MESSLVSWLINLAVGAVGGNIAGALLKSKSLGTVLNSVVGIVGGGGGAALLSALGAGGGGMAGNVAASGVGGAVLLYIVSLFKKKAA
jgi:uncharacterized membrane protein YeaQ/YmgE (transglycosylase-associated protein family)